MQFFRNLFQKQNTAAVALPSEERSAQVAPSPGTLSNGFLESLIGPATMSNVPVTVHSVLGIGALLRGILAIADGLAALSFKVYEERDNVILPAKDHPLYFLLSREPHERTTKFVFFRTLICNALLHGNGIAVILRDSFTGKPSGFLVLDSKHVEIYENPTTGEVIYMVRSPLVPGGYAAYRPADIIHITTLTLGGITGVNIIRKNAENLSIAIASTQYASAFFGNGAHIPGYIKHPGTLSPEAINKIRSGWQKKYGGVANTGTTPMLDEGMEYKHLGLNPTEAMLIENRKFQTEEISRILGVPLHMLNALERATFNNVEVMDIGFVKYTLRPWATNIEEEFNRKAFSTEERRSLRYYTRFNLDSLLRGDTKSRAEFYSKMFQIGAMSPNDIRRKENENPREGGDEYFTPLNFTTGNGDEKTLAEAAKKPTKKTDDEEE